MFLKAQTPQQTPLAKATTPFFKPEPTFKSLATAQQAVTERAGEFVTPLPIVASALAMFQTAPTFNAASNVKRQTLNLPIQAKLTVGQPNDKYEQEADAVADKVIQRWTMPNAVVALPNVTPFNINSIQRVCSACQKEEPDYIQRKEKGKMTALPSVENRLLATKSGGSSLPESTRSKMSAAIGANFSNVRIHTSNEAVQLNQDLSAHAFTHGSDVYFNSGKYSPDTEGGRHLLAHELVHTVQQGNGEKNIQRAPARLLNPNTAEDTEGEITYIVNRTQELVSKEQAATKTHLGADADKDNVSVNFKVCRGASQFYIELAANIPKAARETGQKIIEAILLRKDAQAILKSAATTGVLKMVFTQSKGFEFFGSAQITASQEGTTSPSFSAGVKTDKFEAKATLSINPNGNTFFLSGGIPLGDGVKEINCKEIKQVLVPTYTCEQQNPDKDVEKEREKKTTDAPLVTFLFKHAEFNINISENKLTLAHAQSLLGEGYRVTEVTGFTSPEGLLSKKKGNDFEGNIALANERIAATLSKIETMCAVNALDMRQKCVTNALKNIKAVNGGELYSLPNDKDGLDIEAYIAAEVTDEAKASALRKMKSKQQEQSVYPKLRRTIVAFEKITTSIEKYTEKEKVPNSTLEFCPDSVLIEAKKVFK